MEPLSTPPLPCPECRTRNPESGSACRIGNRRNKCTTCNNFAQNVMRMSAKRLRSAYPEEYAAIRLRVEMDLYPQVMDDWSGQWSA